jgi:hypothetical protein
VIKSYYYGEELRGVDCGLEKKYSAKQICGSESGE